MAKQQKPGGVDTEVEAEDDEFEQFDAEGDELLAEDSEDDDSMHVVSLLPTSRK